MKHDTYYIKCFLAICTTIVLARPAYSQQLIQTFTELNISGNTDFGYSVSGAGDVNGDGYADVIVGAPNYDSNTGRVYIYYGGKSMDDTADVILTGEATNNYFGNSVADAGDVNNDGYDDIIVGAELYDSHRGRAYIYYGGKNMDNKADVILTGEGIGNFFGVSVSGAGDVNGDGYADVIVGANNYINNTTGRAYIYYGGSPMDSKPDLILTAKGSPNKFGTSVSSAGDVNGDGYADVIVGDWRYNSGTGRAFIYYGGKHMDDTADVILAPRDAAGSFGYSVSTAGDLNNDGFADVIIGAPDYNTQTGRAYIYYGGKSMKDTAAVVLTGNATGDYFGSSVSGVGDINGDGYPDVMVGAYGYNSNTGSASIYYGGKSMDNAADVVLTGKAPDNYFGYSVSGAGDVNGDGYADVIVGAYGSNSNKGSAYIYNGGKSVDNTPGITLTGEVVDNYFSEDNIASAGDVNHDGYPDIIVGAPGYNFDTGRAYIYYGGPSVDTTADVILNGENKGDYFGWFVSGAGDVNGDGYADVIVGAPDYNSNTGRAYIYYGGKSMDNKADVTLTGLGVNTYFGDSVSGAGDVNGDGYADVIVGAPDYNSLTGGRAYIYYGGKSMDSTADVTMKGDGAYNHFGASVSGAGDVNGDGYSDVIVGAWRYNNDTGRAYIYYGGKSMDNIADVTLTGEAANSSFGWWVSGAGDINGDGYADVIVGAPDYNSHTGRAYIYYGGKSMDDTADVILTGKRSYDYFGISVSGAGDFNNDGNPDVIIGASGYNDGVGRAYIYYGGNPMDSTADVILTGEGPGNYFGYTVSGVGDVNGDGNADVIVGAVGYNSYNGKVYLYSGSSKPSPVSKTELAEPTRFLLKQNYPNPFNPSTNISFTLPQASWVRIDVYNTLGQHVRTLENDYKKAGHYTVQFHAGALASGVYLYRIQAGNFVQVKKMLYLK